MQREIKFRAWDNVRKIMFYPDELWFKSNLSWNCINRVNGFAVCETDNLNGFTMQYTGLTDKNGKEIYEGDVCSTYNIDEPSNLIDTVVFDNGSFVFKNNYKLSVELRGFKSDYIEIIGNIYENKELLNHKN